jgi:hypothetical protein
MLASRFDDVFIIPVRRRADRLGYYRWNRTVDDLEFSEFGRSPRKNLVSVFIALTCFWGVVGLVIFAPL